MKKIFTLLALSFFSFSVFALDGPSKLSITSSTNANLRVMVDGNKFQSNNSVVMVNDLEQGFHTIKIFREKQRRGSRYNNSYDNNRFELIYSNRIYVKPQYFVDIVINRFGKAFIDEQMMHERYYNEKGGDDWGDSDNVTNGSDQGSNNNDVNEDVLPMSNESFEQFKLSLRNEGFDNARTTIAKQVISENSFSSKQVKEILDQFAFESSKVELAKFAYEYTSDKGSYFLVNDAFTYSSSKQELAAYIQSLKH